ncbi:type IV pilin protein [Gilvimarinus sp. SDUM040013]|uniref:Type IV pilin protein n=1 Tax=Gilvimarinus gilvus TaxID=3058038 RepID=A0ABU4S0L7_9GAMM|nr:type IV pilin protein [Gilvimarinus sp. SDUM040013]MDO3384879.1 type IV pilin protein [Gilvimarinus sp. SDUM040013]MDX6850696.1 type IV pilin protein [Gilvimarinus sp. SDUM040013]
MHKNKGFTMIEILIVVAILGIISAIAYPSYMESVRKSNRADAKATLNHVSQQLHRCYSRDFKYSGCAAASSTTQSGEEFYSINVATTDSTFTVTATATGAPQDKDTDCLTFTIDHLGAKTSTTDGVCW